MRAQKILDESGAVDSNGQRIRFSPGGVSPTTTGKSAVIVISYTSPDPVTSQEALRALTRAYMDWRAEQRSVPYVESFFQDEMDSVRERLEDWEQRRADFMAEEGIVNPRSERDNLLRHRADAASRLMVENARVADLSARLEAIEQLQEERRLDPDIDIYGLGDAEFNDETLLFHLRRELTARRAEYFEKRGRLTDDHPEVLSARQVLEQLELQFDREIQSYVRFLDARIAVARARVASLEATINGVDEQLHGLPDKAARLAQYDRIISALETDYSTLAERHIQAKVQTSGRPEWKVILLQPASKAMRLRTRDYVRSALIPLFALLIGVALAFIVDGLDHSVKDAADAEEHLRVNVLGSLSKFR
jgi:uncharacterized protein involved in exopolysaccharide biosynthesis